MQPFFSPLVEKLRSDLVTHPFLPPGVDERAAGLFAALRESSKLCHKGGMKSLTEHLWFEVPERRGFVNITQTVADFSRASQVRGGSWFVPATTLSRRACIDNAVDG